jgi:glycosyltransferase involved in cell wall biosynthesis
MYPGMVWEAGAARQKRLPEALSRLTPTVIFLTAPYTRNLTDIVRPRAERIHENLLLVHDAFAFRNNRFGKRMRAISSRIDASWVHATLRREGITEYVYWLGVPGPEWAEGMRTDRLVFECLDPCFIESEQEAFDRTEFALAKMAVAVTCTADTLFQRLKPYNKNTLLLRNAISPEMFVNPTGKAPPPPDLLKNCPRPIVGYMGTLDWRIDVETMAGAAKLLPELTFAIIGRINQDQEERVRELRALPNVVMPGPVPLEESEAYNYAFDVGMIPFKTGYIGDGINPTKMYMHLVIGRPVVSTWIREAVLHQPYVTPTRTVEEFAEAVRNAAAETDPNLVAQRIAFAMRNTWKERAEQAYEFFNQIGLLEPSK